MHWRDALNKYIEQMHWLINISQYTLSDISEKKNESITIIRERKDTLLRLEEFRL
jgi:hypothetical protein